MRVLLLIGTRKGVLIAESDRGRRTWRLRGPLISGTWAFHDLVYGQDQGRGGPGGGNESASHHSDRGRGGPGGADSLGESSRLAGRIYAAGSSNWYGPAVWWSDDLGETWAHSSAGLTYGDDGPSVEQIWALAPADGALYAGIDPAGLFRSADGGQTWEHLPALRAHPTRTGWRETKAGLPLHAILAHPDDPQALWVAVGAGGVYRSPDGGASWERLPDAGGPGGQSVLALALAPGRDGTRLYQQSQGGVYRSDDGGDTWRDVSEGLPCRHGFPLAVHPRDRDTAYVVPRNDGHLAVWRTSRAGEGWQRLDRGLPPETVHARVLRRGLATDTLDPVGVYLGTSTGQLFASADEGETWHPVAPYLPPILSLSVAVVEA